MKLEKIFKQVFKQENKRSIENSNKWIEEIIFDFEETFLKTQELVSKIKEDLPQEYFDLVSKNFVKLHHLYSQIENDLRNTKEGEEYFTLENQLKEKPDSLLQAEMDIQLDNSAFKNFKNLKKRLDILKAESQKMHLLTGDMVENIEE